MIQDMYQNHYYYLIKLLYAHSVDKQLSEDIIQDVFTALLRNPELDIDERYARRFLKKCATNKLIDYYRKHKPSLSDNIERISDMVKCFTFEKDLEQAEFIQYAMKDLPAQLRQMILAKYYYGYSCQEIADWMGISYGRVKMNIFRAKKMFQKYHFHALDL